MVWHKRQCKDEELRGVLPHQEVARLCGFPANEPKDSTREVTGGVISPAYYPSVRSASYDLRLGVEFYEHQRVDDRLEISRLRENEEETFVIPRNGVAVVTAYEKVNLPDDIVGHLSIKVGLLFKGLIMASQSQVDADYSGQIWALLYNLSNRDVHLTYKDLILRLELVRLPEATDFPYGRDKKGYEDKPLSFALREPIVSSLHSMEAEVKGTRSSLYRSWAVGVIVAGLLTVVPAVATVFGPFGDVRDRVSKLEANTRNDDRTAAQLARQDDLIASLQDELRRLKVRLGKLEK